MKLTLLTHSQILAYQKSLILVDVDQVPAKYDGEQILPKFWDNRPAFHG